MALSVSPSWDVLAGDDGGMTRSKLFGRMERVVWQPPKFIFRIERHRATVMGSSRAELQEWTIDLEQRTKTVETVGRPQVRPMQGRLDVQPIVEEIAAAILARSRRCPALEQPATVAALTTSNRPGTPKRERQ
jgi:hypothetical protein